MLMPSIFGENLFDGWMDRAFKNAFPADRFGFGDFERGMKTDIKDTEDGYELSMELPGFSKEDISAQLRRRLSDYQCGKERSKRRERQRGKLYTERALFRTVQQKFLCRKRTETGRYQGKV